MKSRKACNEAGSGQVELARQVGGVCKHDAERD